MLRFNKQQAQQKMVRKVSVQFSSFDGLHERYSSVREACSALGLSYGAVRNKFHRDRTNGREEEYIWQGGRIRKAQD